MAITYSFFLVPHFYGLKKLTTVFAVSALTLAGSWYLLSVNGYTNSAVEYVDTRSVVIGRTISDTDANISSSEISKILGAPTFAAGTIFLPVFTAVNLSDQQSNNISFLPLVIHTTLLPFFVIALWNIFCYGKKEFVPVFLLINYFAYRILQAFNAVSTLDARQSMPALTLMLIMLPYAFDRPFNRNVYTFSILLSAMAVLAFNLVRLWGRGML
jgi:hypothetical protein